LSYGNVEQLELNMRYAIPEKMTMSKI